MIKDWQELAARLFCFCFFAFFAYVCLKYLLYVLLPFAIAFAIGTGVNRSARRLSELTGVPRSLCAFFIDTLLLLAVGAIAFFACRRLASELSRIISLVSESHGDNVLEPLKKLPVIGKILKVSFTESAQLRLTDLLVRLSEIARPLLGKLLRGSPTALLSVAVTVISVYYVSMDTERIEELIGRLVPRAYRKDAGMLKDSVLFCAAGYVRAYACLFALTFFETFVGLLILKPSYACIGAICVAAVDILPVFGAGSVLIPWGIVSIATGDVFSGVGLIVTYIVITVVRQIAEPKILGERLGVHPFFVLVGTFVGARLFGITGMLLSPVFISVALQVIKKRGHHI